MSKARNKKLTIEYLDDRANAALSKGYTVQKWILFCKRMIEKGFEVYLYEARKTFSKYVTIKKGGKSYKVRFSNHKPIKHRELSNDCDFFVGVTHTGVRTTRMAYFSTLDFFGES